MVGIAKRMRKLQSLLTIRMGLGAATLAPEVKRIHLAFAPKLSDGHLGARQFWRKILPRLKFRNPTIPMTVDQTLPQTDASTLTLHYSSIPTNLASSPPAFTTTTSIPVSRMPKSPSSQISAQPSEAQEEEFTHTIPLKHRTIEDIYDEFAAVSGAKEVEPTEEDLTLSRMLKETALRSERDRRKVAEVVATRKAEEARLKAARGSIA
ncbi:hypothetical protein M501DRAFT_1000082 [Patellaria atrata CBS 101060]|uniref:Ribosomal protein/NADH dehydrogenase domain-containing protein n=1 Tax=Patellaria atrata CBS 101060 TaxID=1346257 RepID=A0A9P4S1G5_9PEZI|nr:hypothetical protein M501DRAFT_1000082 [Patellaria atrata CBS 101060]